MNTSQSFWTRVKKSRAAIAREILDMPWQPKSGNVFVTSLENQERGTTPGRVIAVSLDLAARLLASGTHALASEIEVSNFRAAEANAKTAMRAAVPRS